MFPRTLSFPSARRNFSVAACSHIYVSIVGSLLLALSLPETGELVFFGEMGLGEGFYLGSKTRGKLLSFLRP
jgi:hypothetical protein